MIWAASASKLRAGVPRARQFEPADRKIDVTHFIRRIPFPKRRAAGSPYRKWIPSSRSYPWQDAMAFPVGKLESVYQKDS